MAHPIGGSSVYVDSDLKFVQRIPLLEGSVRGIYNSSSFGDHSFTSGGSNLIGGIISNYFDRNGTQIYFHKHLISLLETLQLGINGISWTPKVAGTQGFNIHLRIRVPEMPLLLRPSVVETLKGGWIQYISLFWVIFFALKYIREWTFQYRLVETEVVSDVVPPIKSKQF